MATKFLWINKDVGSEYLSQSAQREDSDIRRHVQKTRQRTPKPGKSDKSARTSSHKCQCRESKPSQADSPESNDDENAASPERLRRESLSAPNLKASLSALNLDLTETEQRSLHFFVQRTAREWSGWQDVAFWNKLVLQACSLNKAIAHGLIALAAFHESSEMCLNDDYQNQLRELALAQYSKSAWIIGVSTVSLPIALISCMILSCLQNFQDSHQAWQLLRSGTIMLDEIDGTTSNSETYLTSNDRHMVEQYIRPLFERLQARFCSIVDPAAALAVSVRAKRLQGYISPDLPQIPTVFQSLLEARNCLEDILTWGHDSVPEPDLPLEVSSFHDTLEKLLDLWEDALDAEFTQHCTTEPWILAKSRKLLRVARLFGAILLETFGTCEETVYDEYVSRFGEMLSIIQDVGLATGPIGKLSFGIDNGLLDILCFMGSHCRDPYIRRTAMDILATDERVEGDRLGKIGASIITAGIDLEEQGLTVTTASDVPECRRRRLLQDFQYFGRQEIRVLYVSSPYDLEKGARVEETWVGIPKTVNIKHPKISPVVTNGPELPSITYGRSHAAFLEDVESKKYYRINLSSYYFPIPRI